MGQVLRKDVSEQETWDLTSLYNNHDEFYVSLKKLVQDVTEFNKKYAGQLTDVSTIESALKEQADIIINIIHLSTYAELLYSTDTTNAESQKIVSHFSTTYGKVSGLLSFVESEILQLEEEAFNALIKQSDYPKYLSLLKRQKEHTLHPEVEKTLAMLSPTFGAPYEMYGITKMLDIEFGTFEANGTEYPLDYVSFEGDFEVHSDTETRRAAFKKFSGALKKYENTTAATYNAHVQQEKIESELRGYDSVIDFLLDSQDVTREMYDRQIDVISEELAPHMRRYAKLLKQTNNLDKVKFEDLRIPLDPTFEPDVSIEGSKEYIKEALSVLGEDYMQMVNDSYEKRWIDFPQNKGKQTGAYCASPYGVNPFIFISWTSKMTEVFVLAHELGHAGHFNLANQYQNVYQADCSMYFVEAPSTMNEMLMANSLLRKSEDPKFKRWVISSIISRTYFHNMVTHLLEAKYQREVYRYVDKGEAMTAPLLNEIKKKVISDFWGDAVEITEGAELTWMRQPHYYMGLYPYTYSAGLTIGTVMSKRIEEEGQPAVEDWLNVLKSGGSKSPTELAALAGIDITNDKPLKETIEYIGNLIDELEKLTDEIG
ncbi:oligoendopeptidase F [Mammaliicoccus stepanovicii]|uniref:Oligopeptidase F n=1 Tax=Mammaliicoccus stepanovicii TaxID=643214 RepID=A0A239ZCB5_9STAP|nr:oligoendopeptidase F [Mammaliicoccus stepanovicii]PNZ74116.1 oligoendopeptidase F [Mammaliicoccus stepanovicii]GGI42116.1 oligoendopeptidase F [Mammaliicoccus stepanovicii]SNV68374.1 putative peptidase family M3 protein [Mammaliicoccus stepanovicii]